ncbi:hypothetical protein BDV96DRAFT_639452 [Lophiotrema nucula]|uniref:Uncharacterized protein n=1 Tax=Lophiotrema nucula TaxID=690887 RepID=A0A6A5ZWZ1_9PLEO|nr:hypothetical protein BDV96DRAFT_639452 [Lophiotrema nucula]
MTVTKTMSVATVTDRSKKMSMTDFWPTSSASSVTLMTDQFSDISHAPSNSSVLGTECSSSSKKGLLNVDHFIIYFSDSEDDSDSDDEQDDEQDDEENQEEPHTINEPEPENYSPLKALLTSYSTLIYNGAPKELQDTAEQAIWDYLHTSPVTLTDVKLLIPDYGTIFRLTAKLATNIGLWHSKDRISSSQVEAILEYLFTAPNAGKAMRFENSYSNIAAFTNAPDRSYKELWEGADWEEAECPQFKPPLLTFEKEDGVKGFWYEKNVLFDKVKEQVDRFQRQRAENEGRRYKPERLHKGYGVPEKKVVRKYEPKKPRVVEEEGPKEREWEEWEDKNAELSGVEHAAKMDEKLGGAHPSVQIFTDLPAGEQHSFASTASMEGDIFALPPTPLPEVSSKKAKIAPCIPLTLTKPPLKKPKPTVNLPKPTSPPTPKIKVNLPPPKAYARLNNLPIRPTPPKGPSFPEEGKKKTWTQTRSLRMQTFLLQEGGKKKPVVRLPPTVGGKRNRMGEKAVVLAEEAKKVAIPKMRMQYNETVKKQGVGKEKSKEKVAVPVFKKPTAPTVPKQEKSKSVSKPDWMVAPTWDA